MELRTARRPYFSTHMKSNFDRRLVTILAIVFVNIVGAAMILPVLPLYALEELHLREQVITLVIASYFVAQFLAGPILGRYSDRNGRVPVLIVSQIGTIISFIMMGLANNVWMLLAARVLDGITGGNIIVAQAYLTDVTPKKERTQALGYIFAVFGLGFIIGPALGGLLSAEFGRRIPFYMAAAIAGITTLMTWRLLEESLTPDQMKSSRETRSKSLTPVQLLRNAPLIQILIVSFIAQFGLGLVRSSLALFGNAVLFAGEPQDVILRHVGLLFTTIGTTQFLVQTLLLKRFIRWFGEGLMVVFGNLIRTGGNLLFAVAITPLYGYLAAVLFPFGQGTMMPPLQAMATQTVEDELRGGVLGVYQSILNLAIIAGTALSGSLFAASPALPFWIATALGLAAVIPTLSLLRGHKRALEETYPAEA